MTKSFFLFSILVLVSCHRKIDFAKECATRYPPSRDTFHSVTETIRRDTLVLTDTHIKVDTLVDCKNKDTVRIQTYVACPPIQKVIETRTRFDSIVIHEVNKAQEAVLQNSLDSLNTQVTILRGAKHKAVSWAVIGWVFILLFILFKYIKKWLTQRVQLPI